MKEIHAYKGIVQTQGADDEVRRIIAFSSLFQLRIMRKVPYTTLKIKIVVMGLTSANHEATFTLPDTTVDIGTIQTQPLEPKNQTE